MEIYFTDYMDFSVEEMRRMINSCSPVWKAQNAHSADRYASWAAQAGNDKAKAFWSAVSSGAHEAVSQCDPREKDPVKSTIE